MRRCVWSKNLVNEALAHWGCCIKNKNKKMCTVLLPWGVNQIAVNKYIRHKMKDCKMRSSLFWHFTHCRPVAGYHPHHSQYDYKPKCSQHFSKTSWPLQMGPIDCPKTSVTNCHSTLCKIPEEQRYHLQHTGRLESCWSQDGWKVQNTQGRQQMDMKFEIKKLNERRHLKTSAYALFLINFNV